MLDLAPLLVAMASSGVVVALFVLLDRARLDAYGRARMWHEATLHLAIGGCLLGIAPPAPFVVGAHVWVTRRGACWKRLAKAFLAAVLCYQAQILIVMALLSLHPATRGDVVELLDELRNACAAHPVVAIVVCLVLGQGSRWVFRRAV